MIPYDDLVSALQGWRARQGLPVAANQPGSAPTAAPVAVSTSGSGPRPGSGPRTAPPTPPARPPMPLAAPEDTHDVPEALDVDEAAMIDEQVYENEGDDFAMAFGAAGNAEATQIGGAPESTSDSTDPGAPRGNKLDREEW